MIDDNEHEHIGPYNGHNKSEALPLGCFWFCVACIGFIALMACIGFGIEGFKYMGWAK